MKSKSKSFLGYHSLKSNFVSGVAGYYDCVIIDGISTTGGKLLGKTFNNVCGLGKDIFEA